ncbi:hypothetical protein WJX74_005805 [Apatococcus lobatus]|uniref:DUF7709 domain-containing protein n=1 Tax=Apatococcus lobatus TaxID=904363 RepID=A0AAW1RDZ8_9CHLO
MQDAAKILQKVNNQLLNPDLWPELTLSNGSKVQAGTFGACLAIIRRYNQGERGEVEDAIRLALRTLVRVGLLTCFHPASKTPATVQVDVS